MSTAKTRAEAARKARRAETQRRRRKAATLGKRLDAAAVNLAPASLASAPNPDAPPPMSLLNQLLREKLRALRDAEADHSLSMTRQQAAADRISAAERVVTDAVDAFEKSGAVVGDCYKAVSAATAEVGKLLVQRDDVFEFEGMFYVAHPGTTRFSAFSKPVVLS